MPATKGGSACGVDSAPWSTSFTWSIKDFSKLTSASVRSDCFEDGTWQLNVDPAGFGSGEGTHVSVWLALKDRKLTTRAEYKFTLVNQADARKSHFKSGVPCDVTLKLPSGAEVPAHGQLLQLASPFYRNILEDVQGSDPIPLTDQNPVCDACSSPTAGAHAWVYTLLLFVHKYDFTKLLARLMSFIKGKSEALSHNSELPSIFIVRWLALGERLQLEELCELCLGKLRDMHSWQRKAALIVEVGSEAGTQKKHAVRKEVAQLGQALRGELIVLLAVV
ncbi:hypothetical protein FOA52_003624 [Chlamydomonas sp. UWO 241]|nr:hypothetical protein FOA52_003624 [Chlamydomonas sp. UWO 241]